MLNDVFVIGCIFRTGHCGIYCIPNEALFTQTVIRGDSLKVQYMMSLFLDKKLVFFYKNIHLKVGRAHSPTDLIFVDKPN
jgi:hypothetical protein